jgi:hypothetical protein
LTTNFDFFVEEMAVAGTAVSWGLQSCGSGHGENERELDFAM